MTTLEVETEVTIFGTIDKKAATLIKNELLKAIGAAVKSERDVFEKAPSGSNSCFTKTYVVASNLTVKVELSVNRKLSDNFLEMVIEEAAADATVAIAEEFALQSIEFVVDFVGNTARDVKTFVFESVSSVLSSAKRVVSELTDPAH